MEKVTNRVILEDILEQSGTTEALETNRTEEIVTPPARENTGVDEDYIDELDELFGVSLDDDNAELLKNLTIDDVQLLKNLTIDDVPLDGKSPDMSSESVVHESDYEGLLTDRSEYIAELEKVASQSDADIDDNVRESEQTVDDDDGDTGVKGEADLGENRDADNISPGVGGLGNTTKTCSELQMSTWNSTLVSDCDSATTSATTSGATSGDTMTSEPQPRCDERMSSGKKSAVKFYDDDSESDDVELSR